MSTSTSFVSPAPFPYQSSHDVAYVIERFFNEHVRVSDARRSGSTATVSMVRRVAAVIANAIADRLYDFPRETAFGENEELELIFKKAGDASPYRLVSPRPIVKLLEFCFRDTVVTLKSVANFAPTGDTYVLRANPRLVTFGGQIVWQAVK